MAPLSARELRAINKVLSDPRRFDILKHIAASSCTPCSDLRETYPVSAATISHHLKELEAAGLIETTKRGKFMDITFRRQVWNAYLAELKKF